MEPTNRSPVGIELSRQSVHMLVGLCALLLRWLSYPQALAFAAALIVFNSLVLPRLPGSRALLYRPGERESGFSAGILLYPVSVFILIFAFPLPVAASLWGVLSFGDGMASVAGSLAGRRRLPWNRAKTLEGMLAFALAAAPASAFLYWWVAPNVSSSAPWWRSPHALVLFGSLDGGSIIAISLVVGVVCAILETLRLGIDDNIVAPLGGACVMVGLVYTFGG
jgi:dolichol kinase